MRLQRCCHVHGSDHATRVFGSVDGRRGAWDQGGGEDWGASPRMGNDLAQGPEHAWTSVSGVLHRDCNVLHLGVSVLLKPEWDPVTRAAPLRAMWKRRPHTFRRVWHSWNLAVLGGVRCVLHLGLHFLAATVAAGDGPDLSPGLQIYLLSISTGVLLLGIRVPVPQPPADTGQRIGSCQPVHGGGVPWAGGRMLPDRAVRVLALADHHAQCSGHDDSGNHGCCGVLFCAVYRGSRQGCGGQHQGESGHSHGGGLLRCLHDRRGSDRWKHRAESERVEEPRSAPEGHSEGES
mmetsp:Transcript_38953/g.101965  ORF Transcript_38953/g.101965 Transcript_38953/m.101965 type:complete len:291 (+) Transcript_38953:545-1417(+)